MKGYEDTALLIDQMHEIGYDRAAGETGDEDIGFGRIKVDVNDNGWAHFYNWAEVQGFILGYRAARSAAVAGKCYGKDLPLESEPGVEVPQYTIEDIYRTAPGQTK